MDVFANITQTIDGQIDNLWEHSAQLITSIAPIFSLAFGVYVLLQCWHYYNKGFDESLMDITKRMLGWIVIIALAFNAGNYKTVAQTAYDLPEALASAVSDGEYTENSIDKGFNNAKDKTKKIFDKVDLIPATEMGKYLFAAMCVGLMWLCTTVFFVCVYAFYIVAKISLAAILIIGPLCLGSMLFPSTRQWGMAWINQIANYALTISLYVVLGLIQLNFFDNVIKISFGVFDEIPIKYGMLGAYIEGTAIGAASLIVLPLVIISTIIFFIAAMNVPSIANAITGGASVSAHSRELGQAQKATANIGKAVGKGFGKLVSLLSRGAIKG